MGFPGRNLLYGGVSESRRGQDKDRRWWWSVRVRWWASLALQGSQVASAFKPGRLIGLERLSRLSRVTELPLAGLELSQRKPRGEKIRETCLMCNF